MSAFKDNLESKLRERAKEIIQDIKIPDQLKGDSISFPFTIDETLILNLLILNTKTSTWEIEYPLEVDGDIKQIKIAL